MSTFWKPENACREQELAPPTGDLFGDVKEFEYIVFLRKGERLTFSLRLEYEGELLEFLIDDDMIDSHARCHAVKRGENHPLESLDMEDDRIPGSDGEAGAVMVWDRGTYSPRVFGNLSSAMAVWQGLRRGRMQIEFHGERLYGLWTMEGQAQDWRLKPEFRAAGIWDDEDSLEGWTLDELERMYRLFQTPAE